MISWTPDSNNNKNRRDRKTLQVLRPSNDALEKRVVSSETMMVTQMMRLMMMLVVMMVISPTGKWESNNIEQLFCVKKLPARGEWLSMKAFHHHSSLRGINNTSGHCHVYNQQNTAFWEVQDSPEEDPKGWLLYSQFSYLYRITKMIHSLSNLLIPKSRCRGTKSLSGRNRVGQNREASSS